MSDLENKPEILETVEADPETGAKESIETVPEIVAEEEIKTETMDSEEPPVLGDEALPSETYAEQEVVAPESVAPTNAEEEDNTAAVETPENPPLDPAPDAVPVPGEDKPPEPEHKTPRKKWIPMKFGAEPVPMALFDMHPVTDIIVRRAVEEGIKNSRDLTVYKTTEEWNGYPKDTIILAGLIEEGAPFAIWDPPKRRRKSEKQEEGNTETEE